MEMNRTSGQLAALSCTICTIMGIKPHLGLLSVFAKREADRDNA